MPLPNLSWEKPRERYRLPRISREAELRLIDEAVQAGKVRRVKIDINIQTAEQAMAYFASVGIKVTRLRGCYKVPGFSGSVLGDERFVQAAQMHSGGRAK